MPNIYDQLVTQACADTRMGPVEFRLFYAIVQVYRSNPGECRLSQREWARLAGMSFGGIGKTQAGLEELGYIKITRIGHTGHQSVYITVLKDGKPVGGRKRKVEGES